MATLKAVKECNLTTAQDKRKALQETYQAQLCKILDVEVCLEQNFQDPQVHEALNTPRLKLHQICHTRLGKQFNALSAK